MENLRGTGEQWENRFGNRKHQVQECKYSRVDKLQGHR